MKAKTREKMPMTMATEGFPKFTVPPGEYPLF